MLVWVGIDNTWLDPETAASDAVDTKVPLYIPLLLGQVEKPFSKSMLNRKMVF